MRKEEEVEPLVLGPGIDAAWASWPRSLNSGGVRAPAKCRRRHPHIAALISLSATEGCRLRWRELYGCSELHCCAPALAALGSRVREAPGENSGVVFPLRSWQCIPSAGDVDKSTRMITEPWSYWPALIDNGRTKYTGWKE